MEGADFAKSTEWRNFAPNDVTLHERMENMDLNGLTAGQVVESRKAHGANTLTPPRKTSMWRLYADKYRDPIIRVLLVAACVSLALAFVEGQFAEVIGIFLAIFLATTIGFYFERDAARRFNLLTAVSEEQPVKVVRDGRVTTVARHDVVVGDVVVLDTGDEVPADGKLVAASSLQVDESSLTGEPLTQKHVAAQGGGPEAQPDGEAYPADMVLRSSMVVGGTGWMVVTAVGDATEIGKVARQSTEPTAVKTPLSQQLERLAQLISKVGTAVAALAFAGFLAHDIMTNPLWHTDNYLRMTEVVLNYFMMAVTIVVMAVPEGLPMAVTLALALNMRRMLKSNNLVRKLHACETMGAVTVICTDKTGTLTENKMRVQEMQPAGGAQPGTGAADSALLPLAIALNTTAELDGGKAVGNPTEAALLLWLGGRGDDYRELRQRGQVVDRMPFSTERKYMSTLARVDGKNMLFVKGAPEIVMAMCHEGTGGEAPGAQLRQTLLGYQRRALRTLAVAVGEPAGANADPKQCPQLRLLAVFGISDPLRQDVPMAIRRCQQAGIEVKMVTGDTQATAVEIGRQAGMTACGDKGAANGQEVITGPEFAALSEKEALERVGTLKVMSRARPSDKQRLVRLLQQRGEVVAVTGDGTNDAPALNHAHVGLSLGSGTAVAKNASDITLIDDSFASIVKAVMWGRSLYKNIQRFILFQLTVNVTALLLVLGGSVMGTELPLTVTQILWVNLIMDTFAAMALATLPPSESVLKERPRDPGQSIITRPMGRSIIAWGVLFSGILLALLYRFEHSGSMTVHELTVFFTVFVLAQWWNLLNARTFGTNASAFSHLGSCKSLLAVLALILAGQWVIVTFGGRMFRTEPLDATTWLWMLAATSPVALAGELARWLRRHRVSGND